MTMNVLANNSVVSYCRIDGRLIFLDVEKDLYFQLPEKLESRVLELLDGREVTKRDLHALASHRIASRETGELTVRSPVLAPPAIRSAMEGAPDARISLKYASAVIASVLTLSWWLKRRPLHEVLHMLDRRRTMLINANAHQKHLCVSAETAVASARIFERVRPYVPVTPKCLLDSLSLVHFLAKCGIQAKLVLAVACDPFSAHAWAQYEEIVLNDTVGNTWNYVPIRVL